MWRKGRLLSTSVFLLVSSVFSLSSGNHFTLQTLVLLVSFHPRTNEGCVFQHLDYVGKGLGIFFSSGFSYKIRPQHTSQDKARGNGRFGPEMTGTSDVWYFLRILWWAGEASRWPPGAPPKVLGVSKVRSVRKSSWCSLWVGHVHIVGVLDGGRSQWVRCRAFMSHCWMAEVSLVGLLPECGSIFSCVIRWNLLCGPG